VFEDDCRLFNCQRCQRQVRICRRCDHGNVYCSEDCSRLARRQCVRDAGARYQKKPHGAQLHAARQKNFRKRQKEKLTHHRSPPETPPEKKKVTHHRFPTKTPPAKVANKVNQENGDEELVNQAPDVVRCDFCKRPLVPFARLGPVRRPHREGSRPPRAGWL